MVEKNISKCTVVKHKSFIIYYSFVNTEQIYITASVTDKNINPLSTYSEIYRMIVDYLTKEKLDIVTDRVFGSTNYYDAVLKMRTDILENSGIEQTIPFTFIEGLPYWGEGIAGIQLSAVYDTGEEPVSTIFENEIPVGRKWKKHGAEFIMLQNMHGLQPGDEQNRRDEQASRMFTRVQNILTENSASYRNVVRTWIYLSHILDWYSEFNKARNEKYKEFGFLPGQSNHTDAEHIYLPASTGISGENPFNAAAVLDVLAVIPEPGTSLKIEPTSGVKQKSPFKYGSAFSRAMNIRESGTTTILLSGTASIDSSGKTVHTGDMKSQVLKTFEIVEALIKEEGASLNDICTATVFLKNPKDFSIYMETVKENGFDNIPAVCVIADVCRDDLLFELDATVVFENGTNQINDAAIETKNDNYTL